MLHSLLSRLRAYRRDDSGSVSIEAIIMLPALAWCFLGTYVFFDAYRSQSVNIKTAYTIGDTISRETTYITPDYVDGLYELQSFLQNTDEAISLRVSAIGYDDTAEEYFVRWTEARGDVYGLTDEYLNSQSQAVPIMSASDTAIVVETWIDYEPSYSVGLANFTFRDLIVTRPRFAGQLCWNTSLTADLSTAAC